MRQFTSEQIQSQFDKLPKEIQDAITSSDVHGNIMSIAKKYDLHIDQEGILIDQVGLVMLGLSPSKDFVANFSREANVPTSKSSSIAEEINKEVFSRIRTSMRNIEENNSKQDSLSSLESAGNFTIEPEQGGGDHGMQNIETKSAVIDGIENPAKIGSNSVANEAHTEPLIDRLLAGPVVNVVEKTVQPPKMEIPKPSKSSTDLYREPIQ